MSASRPPFSPPPEPTRYSRKNYWIFVFEGGLFLSGIAFVSHDSVLPGIVRRLGGGDWILAYIPMLMMVGFMLPSLFTAGWMERQGRLLPVVRIFGVFQRLPYLLAALALWGLGSRYPGVALVSVVACPLLSGIMGGITISGWMRLTARVVPGHRRSSGSALRNLIGALVGILAGISAEWILERTTPLTGYAILHGVAFAFLTASYVVFCFTDEPHGEPVPRESHHGLRGQILRMAAILRDDAQFRTYLLARSCGAAVFATVPFMAVTALEVTGRPDAFIGRLLSFQMAGAIAGNLLAGWVGDTLGSRKVLLSARVTFALACVLLMTASSAWAFCVVFLLWGMTLTQQRIGEQTFLVETAHGRPLPTYVALASILQLLTVLIMGTAASLLRGTGRGIAPVALLSLAGMIVSMWLLKTRIRDPRVPASTRVQN